MYLELNVISGKARKRKQLKNLEYREFSYQVSSFYPFQGHSVTFANGFMHCSVGIAFCKRENNEKKYRSVSD